MATNFKQFKQKIPIILVMIVLSPIIAAYCLLWAVMTVGGGAVKRIFKKGDPVL